MAQKTQPRQPPKASNPTLSCTTGPGCADSPRFCLWNDPTECVDPTKFCVAVANSRCANDSLCITRAEGEVVCINAILCVGNSEGGCECVQDDGKCRCPKDPDDTGCLDLGATFSAPTSTLTTPPTGTSAHSSGTSASSDGSGGSSGTTKAPATPVATTDNPRTDLPVGGKVGISIAVLLLVGLAAGLWFFLSRRPPAPRHPAPHPHLAELAPPSRASLDRLAQLPVPAPPS